ncbi:MAG: hypothetical protein GAK45_00353 [Pseudomonas citronellolis]|nr:MAG: hypothetical protein GAK45_00353 [Pseudomonas citronellolis]
MPAFLTELPVVAATLALGMVGKEWAVFVHALRLHGLLGPLLAAAPLLLIASLDVRYLVRHPGKG